MVSLREDERNVLNWLGEYGPLTKMQIKKLLNKEKDSVSDKIIKNLLHFKMMTEVRGCYYGLDKHHQVDDNNVKAVWVLTELINKVEPQNHQRGDYPAQIYFISGENEYEIVVVNEGEESRLKLLQPTEYTRYILVVPDNEAEKRIGTRLPKAPCLFARVVSNGVDTTPMIRLWKPSNAESEAS